MVGNKIYQANNKDGRSEIVERQDIDINTFEVMDEDYAKDAFHYFLRNGKWLALTEVKGESYDLLSRLPNKTKPCQSPLPPLPRLQDDAFKNLNILSDWLADESKSNWSHMHPMGAFIRICLRISNWSLRFMRLQMIQKSMRVQWQWLVVISFYLSLSRAS